MESRKHETLMKDFSGELETNFGEYDFVYPDGEIDTIPTSGKPVLCLQDDHPLVSQVQGRSVVGESKSEPLLTVPGTDVRELYAPPYRCFYETNPSISQLLEAHDYLNEIVEEEGPFEGVLGFSQGAEVAASLLLYQAPDVRFKFAVFISGTAPYDVSALAAGQDLKPVKMHADTHAARIGVPTAHVMGRGDAYREFSKVVLGLCDPRAVKVYDHNGAHVVPRGQEAMGDLTAALNWVVDRATYQ